MKTGALLSSCGVVFQILAIWWWRGIGPALEAVAICVVVAGVTLLSLLGACRLAQRHTWAGPERL